MIRVELITHKAMNAHWDSFTPDLELKYADWLAKKVSLERLYSRRFKFTGLCWAPAQFWIGDDWFQSKGQALVFFDWSFLSAKVLEDCHDWIRRSAKDWHVSIVNDPSINDGGIDVELLLTADSIRIAPIEDSKKALRRFLCDKTDLGSFLK